MPRLVYLSGVGLLLLAGAFLLTDRALSLWPGVTEANVRRVRPGMTSHQVEALLGRPTWVKTRRGKESLDRRHYWVRVYDPCFFGWSVDGRVCLVVLFRHGVV